MGLDGGGRFILAFFDRCAIRASLFPPPAALGVDALIAPTFMIDSEDAAGRGRSALRASRKPEDVSFCSRAGMISLQ